MGEKKKVKVVKLTSDHVDAVIVDGKEALISDHFIGGSVKASATDLLEILALFDKEVLFRACMDAPPSVIKAVVRSQMEKFKDEIYKLK